MAREFLGTGWQFDPASGLHLGAQGEIELARHEHDIEQAVWIILSTARGERVMRPEFGCGLHQYLFAPNNARTAGLVAVAVREALTRWEPRIDLNDVQVSAEPAEPAVLLIHIDYTVRGTDSRHNLVYPFYLERAEAT